MGILTGECGLKKFASVYLHYLKQAPIHTGDKIRYGNLLNHRRGSSSGTILEARRQSNMVPITQRLRNTLCHHVAPAENLITHYSSNRTLWGKPMTIKGCAKVTLKFEGFWHDFKGRTLRIEAEKR